MLRRAVILVTLDENRVALQDQQPGGAIAREVVVHPAALALVAILDGRLGRGALQDLRLPSPRDRPRGEELIEPAHQRDETPVLGADRPRAEGIALGLAELRLVGRGECGDHEQQAREKDQHPQRRRHPRPLEPRPARHGLHVAARLAGAQRGAGIELVVHALELEEEILAPTRQVV